MFKNTVRGLETAGERVVERQYEDFQIHFDLARHRDSLGHLQYQEQGSDWEMEVKESVGDGYLETHSLSVACLALPGCWIVQKTTACLAKHTMISTIFNTINTPMKA